MAEANLNMIYVGRHIFDKTRVARIELDGASGCRGGHVWLAGVEGKIKLDAHELSQLAIATGLEGKLGSETPVPEPTPARAIPPDRRTSRGPS